MIKFLKQAIIRWANSELNQSQSVEDRKIRLVGSVDGSVKISSERENRINFTIHLAEGGQIIECCNYNSKNDEYVTKLYVVQNGESISEKLENIICVEALRR